MSANTQVKTSINWKEILEKSQRETFNTYDLIKADFKPLEKVVEAEIIDTEVVEAKEVDTKDPFIDIKRQIRDLNKIAEKNKKDYNIKEDAIFLYIQRLVETFNNMREILMKEAGDLPASAIQRINGKSFEFEDDLLTKAALAPRAELDDLKYIAEKLGFMITPWEYHNKRSFENENKKIKNAIEEFEKLEKYFDLYVISPINYWDVRAHALAKDPNKWIYFSNKIKDVIASIEIQLPLWREILMRMNKAESEIQRIDKDIETTFKNIEDMQMKLEKVVDEITRMWQEIAEAKDIAREALSTSREALSTARAAQAKAESANAMMLRVIDPLLFAVPKNHNMNKNCECIIGPVWGPDFNWLVLAAEDLVPQINQRQIIEKANPFLLS